MLSTTQKLYHLQKFFFITPHHHHNLTLSTKTFFNIPRLLIPNHFITKLCFLFTEFNTHMFHPRSPLLHNTNVYKIFVALDIEARHKTFTFYVSLLFSMEFYFEVLSSTFSALESWKGVESKFSV